VLDLFSGEPRTQGVGMISGGGGSWRAMKLKLRSNPAFDLRLLFTDTLYEDADTYRFLVEGAANIYGRRLHWLPAAEDFPDYRVSLDTPIEEYRGNPEWRAFLDQIRSRAAEDVPELNWIADGRDPWEVYRDERYLGNSRKDPCSKILKRKLSDKWLKTNADPYREVLIYGIGEHEKHRFDGRDHKGRPIGILHRLAAKGWVCEAPLIGAPEINPALHMRAEGIAPARNYGLGYLHDNCGGFCCKGGKAHYENRLRVHPDRYLYDEAMEQKVSAYIGKSYTILTETVNKVKQTVSLAEFRTRLQADPNLHHDYEPGDSGCGCMIDEDDEDIAA
jgi:hypothetical protein